MARKLDLARLTEFEWDQGNSLKNWFSHQVTDKECEEIFSNQPLILLKDAKHSQHESRWGVLGQTDQGRLLAVYFTIRGDRIRIISARDQGKKDRKTYQQPQKL